MENNNVTKLHYQDKEIILIATAHVSQESVTLVKEVLEAEKPDSICIELDEKRYETIKNPKAWENTDLLKVIKEGRAGYLLANLALSSYQKKMAKKLQTNVGGEMLQGMKSADELGATLVLADRDIQTTFLRIWRKLNFWEKSKLLSSIFFSFEDDADADITEDSLAELLEKDMLESVLADMKKEFPKIGHILLSERDMYLANKIKNAPGKKIAAVLGGAHVPGISLELYKDQDMDEISQVPPKSILSKIIGWLFPLTLVSLIVYSFILGFDTGISQLSTWILWNSGLAALFTLLSAGHPLTVLTSFVTAPIATLNPLIGVGMFAGLAEATFRKPTVEDLKNASDDIFSLKGFFKNRVLRILLIVMTAGIGGALGNLIGGLDLIRNLF